MLLHVQLYELFDLLILVGFYCLVVFLHFLDSLRIFPFHLRILQGLQYLLLRVVLLKTLQYLQPLLLPLLLKLKEEKKKRIKEELRI